MQTHYQVSIDSPRWTDEQLEAICESASVIGCECPSSLVQLLQRVRGFRDYTYECIDRFPEDRETHEWLTSKANHLETCISQIILEFLHRESLIDENNQLLLQDMYQRSLAIALRQAQEKSSNS